MPDTPPPLTTDLTDLLTPWFTRVEQLLNDGWDTIAPWLTLAVAVGLIRWWLSWRSGRKGTPGSDDW